MFAVHASNYGAACGADQIEYLRSSTLGNSRRPSQAPSAKVRRGSGVLSRPSARHPKCGPSCTWLRTKDLPHHRRLPLHPYSRTPTDRRGSTRIALLLGLIPTGGIHLAQVAESTIESRVAFRSCCLHHKPLGFSWLRVRSCARRTLLISRELSWSDGAGHRIRWAMSPLQRRWPLERSATQAQFAASLSAFNGRTLILMLAGFAAKTCSSLVKGLIPFRRGLAGTFTEVILSSPGMVN